MTQKLFVYGTLQFPSILKRLTGKTFSSKPAILKCFKRCCVKDCDYPALIPLAGANTKGLILEDIDDVSLKAIDFFEGDEYKRKKVTAIVEGEKVTALVYVWNFGTDKLVDRDWDATLFERKYIDKYPG